MERLSLERLIEEWKTDSKVNLTEPGLELARNPNLHAKWVEQLHLHSVSAKAQRQRYASLRRIRADYYNGRMSPEELQQRRWEPFQLVLKGDVALYLEADPELQALETKITLHEEARDFCLSVLKSINNRSFDLRGYIDWLKFTHGGGST